MAKEDIRRHFEEIAGEYDGWKEKASYYYALLADICREFVPEGASVLEVGCGTGTLLASLRPGRGLGIDVSERMVGIAAAKFPGLSFAVADAERFETGETFDYVIVPDVVEHLTDVPAMFRSVRRCCHDGSRVIVTCINPIWAPVLHAAERLGMKMPEGEHKWLPAATLEKMAAQAGFGTSSSLGRILLPKRVPILSGMLNRAARLPLLAPVDLLLVLEFVPVPGASGGNGAGAPPSTRKDNEIAHGRMLAGDDPEMLWGWKTPAGRARAARRAALIAEAGGLGPGRRVLEIGCGTGMFTEMFAGSGAEIVAVDISGDLLARARERKLPPARVRFLEKRFEECEVDGPFDAVIGSSILHHLEVDPSLAKIRKLLKPGGTLCFAEPNYLNPQVFMERKFTFLRKSLFSYVSPDETAFVRGPLRSRLEKAGFAEIRIVPFDWLHPSTPERLVPLVDRLGRVIERVPLLREFAGSLLIRAR
jgi:2-polyprenyl-3-methyl-5-hydroxy-6-metoxy-1,4-benzoquinol methylase